MDEFEIIQGNTKTVYTIAGQQDGVPIYGRGQRILIALINQGSTPLDVTSINLRLVSFEQNYDPNLKYDKLVISLPHTRPPIEEIEAPIQWNAGDQIGTSKSVGEGRIRLGPNGSQDDIHQIRFTVEAKASGLWIYQLIVEYDEPRTGRRQTLIREDKFMILLRGR